MTAPYPFFITHTPYHDLCRHSTIYQPPTKGKHSLCFRLADSTSYPFNLDPIWGPSDQLTHIWLPPVLGGRITDVFSVARLRDVFRPRILIFSIVLLCGLSTFRVPNTWPANAPPPTLPLKKKALLGTFSRVFGEANREAISLRLPCRLRTVFLFIPAFSTNGNEDF